LSVYTPKLLEDCGNHTTAQAACLVHGHVVAAVDRMVWYLRRRSRSRMDGWKDFVAPAIILSFLPAISRLLPPFSDVPAMFTFSRQIILDFIQFDR